MGRHRRWRGADRRGGRHPWGVAAHRALHVADFVLVPCRPSAADLDTLRLIQVGRDQRAAVVLNAAPTRGGVAEEAHTAIAEHLEVAPIVLKHSATRRNN
jgi:hypothetical protein